MPNTPDLTQPCLDVGPIEDDAVLPVSPFYALRYQFGMLLGVEDFDGAQAYPRGKMRLHNAWLHGPGVAWGFGVTAPPRAPGDPALSGSIEVDPGLAFDAMGHELHLDAAACVNVGAWYAAHKDDPDVKAVAKVAASGAVDLALRVEVRFKACLTRQVPAMAEPCDGGATATAYSRAFETVEIKLVAGAAERPPAQYHRLRLLFGLDATKSPAGGAEADVAAARAAIAAASDADAEFLGQFRRLAALDEIELGPGKRADGTPSLLFPVADDAPIVLANLGVHLEPATAGLAMTTVEIHPEIRPTHVATSTIQELNCCAARAADAGGPRADPSSVARQDKTITFALDRPLQPASVAPDAFTVMEFDEANGWSGLDIGSASFDAVTKRVKVVLKEAPQAKLVRLVARGTGPAPLLGADLVPFAGAIGGPPGSQQDGNDFAFTLRS